MSDRIKNYLSFPPNKNKLLEKMRKYRAEHPDECDDAPADDFIMTMLMNGYIDEDAPRLARDINDVLSGRKKPTPQPEPTETEEEPELILEEYPKNKYEVWTWVPERDDPDLNGKNKKGV